LLYISVLLFWLFFGFLFGFLVLFSWAYLGFFSSIKNTSIEGGMGKKKGKREKQAEIITNKDD